MRYWLILVISSCFQLLQAQCPSGQLVFTSQQEIDDFSRQFPNCTRAESGIFISGNDIQDLQPLEQLTYVAQALEVVDNPNLRSLQGLHNITQFEVFMPPPPAPPQSGSIVIENNVLLDDLDALAQLKPISNSDFISLTITLRDNQSLTSIEGLSGIDKGITFVRVATNPRLQSLRGLHNITSTIGIDLDNNAVLSAITAIETIEIGRAGIRVVDNTMLSQCAVRSICNTITTNTDNVTILNNAKGCDTKAQVEAACQNVLATQEFNLKPEVYVYPNPTTGILNVDLTKALSLNLVEVYSLLGSKVMTSKTQELNLSQLKAGIYFISITTAQGNIVKRIIKQ